METFSKKSIKEDNTSTQTPEEQLSQLFGSYKAEWLREELFGLFQEPTYFPELTTSKPCVLVGGRGTGKTTVLRGLSYEGQFALRGYQPSTVPSWPYYGFYYRVNTNRVTAFKGPELSEEKWRRLFAHYFNLLMCDLILQFLRWYDKKCITKTEIDEDACKAFATSLHLPEATTVFNLSDQLTKSLNRFEADINNIVDSDRPSLSMQGQPLDVLIKAVSELPKFKNKNFFFLLDEYENLEDYQQEIINTLIKHAGQLYTFKIGVREMGWRRRATLNPNEQLISPADYDRINIVDKLEGGPFKKFALDVCNSRIAKLQIPQLDIIRDISDFLSGLTEDQEAQKLGVVERAKSIKSELFQNLPNKDLSILDSIPPLQIYFFQFWADGKNMPLKEVFEDFLAHPSKWKTRYDNYKHSLLYTLRGQKRGIQKYYAGWEVFTQIAAGNIRYLLELVDRSLMLHIRKDGNLSHPVPPEVQTLAAESVGRDNLAELEVLSVHGAQLTKLLLGLGRVFSVMATQASGHAPEVTQFHLGDSDRNKRELSKESIYSESEHLLKAAVMHLALIRSPGNKLADERETRDSDYMIHPIFCPFFVFSYRKKRKMVISGEQIMGLIKNHKRTIRDILSQNRRTNEEPLPEQLLLFEAYYRDDS